LRIFLQSTCFYILFVRKWGYKKSTDLNFIILMILTPNCFFVFFLVWPIFCYKFYLKIINEWSSFLTWIRTFWAAHLWMNISTFRLIRQDLKDIFRSDLF
jgi:hypothetical protein